MTFMIVCAARNFFFAHVRSCSVRTGYGRSNECRFFSSVFFFSFFNGFNAVRSRRRGGKWQKIKSKHQYADTAWTHSAHTSTVADRVDTGSRSSANWCCFSFYAQRQCHGQAKLREHRTDRSILYVPGAVNMYFKYHRHTSIRSINDKHDDQMQSTRAECGRSQREREREGEMECACRHDTNSRPKRNAR